MRKRTWQPKPTKPPPRPRVADDVRDAVDVQAALVIATLKKRLRKKPSKLINWREDVFTRWHRDALYFVVVMRTPHGFPPTFETHAARMEHAGDGKFNLAVPMRRGWNTIKRESTPDECLREIIETVIL